ncbi:MAG TPA: protein kinase [Polyangiaceae bacterium]|nr:protein kinase [Polyangiaceae bacterium]
MAPQRVAHREIAGGAPSQGKTTGVGERLGTALASPLGVVVIVPGLVFAVGLFLTLIGQSALRESTSTLGRDKLAEQTRFAAQGIASSLSHANPLLDRMRELGATWTPHDPLGPLAHELRGLVQGRPGVAYASVSFPDGTFRGLYLERGALRFVASEVTPSGTIVRRYELVGSDGLAQYEEKPWTYDPRKRDFYRLAVEARHRIWTKPYTFFSSHQTGVTCADPVFEPGPAGALRAVLTADFDVYALSRSIVPTPIEGAKTLLYASDGTLLAYPEGAAALDRLALPLERTITLGDLHDRSLDAFLAASRERGAPLGEFLRFESETEPMLAMVAPVPELPELDWNVAALVPERVLFRERIAHEWRSLSVATSALVLALVVSLVFARHVVRVRRRAARATDRARELGSYQLVERLGAGGMGEVWRAEHRLLARQAAIKLVRAEKLASPRGSSSHLLERFRREAQTLASLESRNTISLYDYGVTDDGTFFFVMELLDGLDLDTLVQHDGPQPAGRVIQILLQALSSLAEAHDAGLVHRDVKPANLFVCRAADEVDIVKVLDFGIVQSARQASERPSPARTPADLAQSDVTGEHPLGTPAFMAPEQILVQPTDGRADLYGLGCVAVWLLSGQLPFRAEGALAMMLAHVTRPVDLAGLLPREVPSTLLAILERCLAKSPEGRPRDARTLAAELRAIEVPEAQRWNGERARDWWGRQAVRLAKRQPAVRGMPPRAEPATTDG